MKRLLLLILLAALPVQAATYLVPEDREMVQRADDIVVVTGVTSIVERSESGGIVTRFVLRVEETLKGDFDSGDHLTVTELGGRLGDDVMIVAGAPEYFPGERYLVFTETNGNGEPITFGMELGRFRLIEQLAVRNSLAGWNHNLEPYSEGVRDAKKFIRYIRALLEQRLAPPVDYFVEVPRSEAMIAPLAFTRRSYLMSGDYRWQSPNASMVHAGTQPGLNGPAAKIVAIAQWNATDSEIAYTDGGEDNTATAGFTRADGKNTVLFNDPNGEVASGVGGIGGISRGQGTYLFGGETFGRTQQVDVVINDNFTPASQTCLNSVLSHELGHTLGIRHADQGKGGGTCPADFDCSNVAVMTAVTLCSYNGTLRTWDKTVASTIYPASCTSPAIAAQSSAQKVPLGVTSALSVTATGTAPLHYAWFEGEVDDVSRPVGSDAAAFVTPKLLTTTKYWVRVTNNCGTAKSAAMVVEVVKAPRRRSVGRS